MKQMPETQIKHSLEIVKLLGERYSIVVTEYAEATSGIENTTLIVTGIKNKYVFRIYRQGRKSNAEINTEIDFMTYLGANGIPIPSVLLNNKGEYVTIFEADSQEWQLIVMNFVEGEHPTDLPAVLLADLATTQARMHQLADSYTGRLDNVPRLSELIESEFIHQIDFTKVNDELRAFLERGSAYRVALNTQLATGLCHLDYDEQNILCDGDNVTAVLDFDDMAIVPFVVCLAYTLWHVRHKHGDVAANAYIKLYEQIRPLTEPERQLIPSAMLFRHYMISALKILDGDISTEGTRRHLQEENTLLSLKLSTVDHSTGTKRTGQT